MARLEVGVGVGRLWRLEGVDSGSERASGGDLRLVDRIETVADRIFALPAWNVCKRSGRIEVNGGVRK